MSSLDSSKHSTATLSMPRVAQPNDLPTLRFEANELRDTSAELGYGCVDWFIYGADARIASAALPLTS
ncbi:MAG TPA: hypothetical protein VHY19_05220 [Steroidobacteraceae bacterium]|nr:hypothetical protein [Steroidobacteraceae bacterium]